MVKSQFIISAPNSDAGKTTITLGLLRLFKQKGIRVQPFKVGPDYIDPKFHRLACGNTSVNLDLFMMNREEINRSLVFYGKDNKINCIEGVMGLFDGARKDERSTAELAKKLNTPVLLVVDAKAVAYSVAPLIQGFKNFDKELKIAGVVFNRVGSESHYSFLKEACEDINVKSFGYLKKLKDIEIPSRHLGLNIAEIEQFDTSIERIAKEMEKTIDWKSILENCTSSPLNANPNPAQFQHSKIKFAVAQDEAFNFIYLQNIQAMERLGSVDFFSPLHDKKLPDADFVYLPGGYPECYLSTLSGNKTMLQSIKDFAENGGQVLAECGGMMYLGKAIIDPKGKAYEMVNLFDYTTDMQQAKLHLGYRTIRLNNEEWKGHEFHYSNLNTNSEKETEALVLNAKQEPVNTPLFRKKNILASYIHFYFGNPKKLIQIIKTLQNENIYA